jgi:drug/metabolite transporter (DMT)-like permease
VWLIAVLAVSIQALKFVSVPLYVVARNTVPFQTAILDKIFLGKKLSPATLTGLMLTFIGEGKG